jgi:predicted transposase/invertase (TIGR01784 family)
MTLSKFLDPKNDFAFKRIFGTEKNQAILIDFINAIVGFSGDECIQNVIFLKTSQDPEIAYKKQSLVDVLCTDELGRQYIIEMQVARTTGFEKRAQYYAAKAYARQLQEGDGYAKLKAIIFVAITDFVMFPDKAAYKSSHRLLDDETYSHDLKDFSFTFLELPKFQKNMEALDNIVERWTYFFKHAEETKEKDIERIAGADFAIIQAYEELNRFSWTDIELNTYEAEEKRERDEKAVILAKLEDAKAEGKTEGFIEIARKMLKKQVPTETIAEFTGLPIEVIENLKKEEDESDR